MSNYVSSVIQTYGDTENVKRDVVALNEILSRQGPGLLLDVIAEFIGNTAIKFDLTDLDRERLQTNILTHLQDAIDERT